MLEQSDHSRSSRQAVLRWAWILFQAGWGAALSVILFFGPLSLSGWPVWIAGLAGAFIMGSLWLRAGRRLRLGLHAFNFAVLLLVGVATLRSLSVVGTFPPPSNDRGENFQTLWRAMDAAYPYFEQKSVDWEAVYEQNAPRVASTVNDEEYRQILREIFASLDDLHTRVNGGDRMACCFAVAAEIEGQAVVTKAGQQATEAGLIPGSVILSVEGQPVEDRVTKYFERYYSESGAARRDAFFYILALYDGDDKVSVDFIDPQGVERAAELTLSTQGGQPAGPELDSTPMITADRLESGIAVIHIPTFSDGTGHDLVAEFDQAIDSVFDAPGLILDLRGNGGGSTMISDAIAGRLLAETFVYGREHFRHRLPQRLWRTHFDYTVRPRQPVYAGPVAVIIDWTNASTAENFLVALVDSERVITVGQTTAGSSGNPIHFRIPGGDCQFSTGDFRRLNGLSIEGNGIEPDAWVDLTIDDIILQSDAFIDTAENALLGGIR